MRAITFKDSALWGNRIGPRRSPAIDYHPTHACNRVDTRRATVFPHSALRRTLIKDMRATALDDLARQGVLVQHRLPRHNLDAKLGKKPMTTALLHSPGDGPNGGSNRRSTPN